MNNRASKLIKTLGLSPHPEGGYYKEVYRSATTLHSPQAGDVRNALTDIYFLLPAGQISRLHRVRHDEIWHLYEGGPLVLVEIVTGFSRLREVLLDGNGEPPNYRHCVSGGNWQGAYSRDRYSLVGCTVAPGFDFVDFEFLRDNAQRETMVEKFPEIEWLL